MNFQQSVATHSSHYFWITQIKRHFVDTNQDLFIGVGLKIDTIIIELMSDYLYLFAVYDRNDRRGRFNPSTEICTHNVTFVQLTLFEY